MDVMAPRLIWVKEQCYRFFDSNAWNTEEIKAALPRIGETNPEKPPSFNKNSSSDHAKPSSIDEKPSSIDEKPSSIDGKALSVDEKPWGVNGEAPQAKMTLNRDRNGFYTDTFFFPKRYSPLILGQRGRNRDRIQRETRTSIWISRNDDPAQCDISARRISYVWKAKNSIDEELKKARKVIEPTHFLSVPLTDDSIKANFVKFRDLLLNDFESQERDVPRGVFQSPERLHLMLGMLLLVDEKEESDAVTALIEWKETIFNPIIEKNGPIKIKIEGLDCADEFRPWVDIVYAQVSSENDAFRELTRLTEEFFTNNGMMTYPNDAGCNLELINGSFAVKPASGRVKKHEMYAGDLLMPYKNYFFGETELKMLCLCRRDKYQKDGYYLTVAKMSALRE